MRYEVSQVFSDHQIPHVLWFENALRHYGVPTALFDPHILIPDIDHAANVLVLVTTGWTFDMQPPHHIGNAKIDLAMFSQ